MTATRRSPAGDKPTVHRCKTIASRRPLITATPAGRPAEHNGLPKQTCRWPGRSARPGGYSDEFRLLSVRSELMAGTVGGLTVRTRRQMPRQASDDIQRRRQYRSVATWPLHFLYVPLSSRRPIASHRRLHSISRRVVLQRFQLAPRVAVQSPTVLLPSSGPAGRVFLNFRRKRLHTTTQVITIIFIVRSRQSLNNKTTHMKYTITPNQ